MKMVHFEIFGTLFAAIGFLLLSESYLLIGFIIGVFSCFCLIPIFYIAKFKYIFSLQLFFLTVNINGILNNWV